MFRVIIAGGRDFDDYQLLKATMDKLLCNITDEITVVCGQAKGADTLGEQYAMEKGYTIDYYPAQWKLYGKRAGYLRNEQMAQNADALAAFWNGESRGTKNMIELAKRYALRNSSYIPSEELTALWKQYGADENGWITMEDSDRMMEDHPEFSRNTGAGILEMVQNHSDGMKLQDSINFAADGLFCEWAWVIDLDAGTFEGYCGFGQTPLAENDRFYFLRDLEKDNGYHGVRLAAKWNLDALPTDEEFLAAFKNDEEEEETPTF